MATIQENRAWNVAPWELDGDNWVHMAKHCGQPYSKWKQSIVDCFIKPNIDKDSVAVDFACGHGRWTRYFLDVKQLILVDLNESCIDFCKQRYKKHENIEYFVNDGKTLPFIQDNSVDFVWSFDSFVHMERDVIDSYMCEFSRILKHDGRVIIHHSGRNHQALNYKFLANYGVVGTYLYQILSMQKLSVGDGWRSHVSKQIIQHLADMYGLRIVFQVDRWGDGYSCHLYRDCISCIVKE